MTDREKADMVECVKNAIANGLITALPPKAHRTQEEIKAVKRERRKLRHIRVIVRSRSRVFV